MFFFIFQNNNVCTGYSALNKPISFTQCLCMLRVTVKIINARVTHVSSLARTVAHHILKEKGSLHEDKVLKQPL